MADNPTLIAISAFSGLAGALLTQAIAAVNTYYTDKRKQASEFRTQYRNKKVEIGESFYYVTGEKLASIKKNVGYWKNWNNQRSEASLDFLNKETQRFNNYMDKLNADNWKFNLIGLYFNVFFSNEDIVKANDRSHQLFLIYLDLADKIKKEADEMEKELLYQRYAFNIFDMCTHYEQIYMQLERDMKAVREQLLKDFSF